MSGGAAITCHAAVRHDEHAGAEARRDQSMEGQERPADPEDLENEPAASEVKNGPVQFLVVYSF